MRELVFPPKINASVEARWQLTGDDKGENGGGGGGGQKFAAYNSSNIIHKPHWIVLDRSQRVIVGFIDSSLDANFQISGDGLSRGSARPSIAAIACGCAWRKMHGALGIALGKFDGRDFSSDS